MAVTYTAGRKPTEGGIWIAIVGNKATFFIERGGIKITLCLGWSWVEWGGVGLARLQFWLQNADFGLLGKDGILVTY